MKEPYFLTKLKSLLEFSTEKSIMPRNSSLRYFHLIQYFIIVLTVLSTILQPVLNSLGYIQYLTFFKVDSY